MFPFSTAIKLPVFFYGKIRFSNLDGEMIIDAPITKGMIGFGQHFEFPSTSKGTAELFLQGKMICKGNVHIGKDVCIKIIKGAVLEMGHMACFGSDVRVVCTNKIKLGNWAGIGYQSQLVDTNSHPMFNTETRENYPLHGEIELGSYNAVSNKVSIMLHTKTPNNCVIASNSLCNKDYSNLGENILLGGIPAKKIKDNFNRDWESEKEILKQNKIIW
ncbi:acyltransferase [Marixanthomonas ophiurae]|nr:transferase [Marixanthomonas ophiurae]